MKAVEDFLNRYHLNEKDIGYCEICMQEECIFHNIFIHKCTILDYVDDYGEDCSFYKTRKQYRKEKINLRKRLKELSQQDNADYIIRKFLKYNPEIKEDGFFYDLIKDYIEEEASCLV